MGEDFGGGNKNLREEESGRRLEERSGDLEVLIQHAVPIGRRIEAPQGGVPPPNVFGVWSVAIREVVRRNKALRFEFSGRRSYGFCSRLCPRQVLGFSALSSAGSWIF